MICTSYRQLDIRKLLDVYIETIALEGKNRYPHKSENMCVMDAEQDFYQYLTDFFHTEGACYFIWTSDERYESVLRIEPYRDGLLIEGLETAPESRRKGFAKQLLSETIKYFNDQSNKKIYSHIHKQNIASIKTHLSCGFEKLCNYAVFIDGSVDYNYITYIKNAVPN